MPTPATGGRAGADSKSYPERRERPEIYRAPVRAGAELKTPETTEETGVELAIKAIDAKILRWQETLEEGLLSLKQCAGRIKELRRQREELLRRRTTLQNKSRSRQNPTDTDGVNGSVYP